MSSFLTLMNENQLNKLEQRQVYGGIKSDYENLIRNYEQVKRNEQASGLQNELDNDV
jgi:hypothetical protein